MSKRFRKWALLAVVFAMIAAACGGDADEPDATTAAPTTQATTAAPVDDGRWAPFAHRAGADRTLACGQSRRPDEAGLIARTIDKFRLTLHTQGLHHLVGFWIEKCHLVFGDRGQCDVIPKRRQRRVKPSRRTKDTVPRRYQPGNPLRDFVESAVGRRACRYQNLFSWPR